MSEYSFPDIDTSYWKTKDKDWMAERKSQWEVLAPKLKERKHKSQRAITIIKRYYLQGKMPNFEALSDWNPEYSHLDLFCFIWMHPSRDESLLRALRDDYMHYSLITEQNVWHGIGGLLADGEITATVPFIKDGKPIKDGRIADRATTCIFTNENEFLFDILIGDLSQSRYPERGGAGWSIDKLRGTFRNVFAMSRILCLEALHPINQDALCQYDNYLEYWYQSCLHVPSKGPYQIKNELLDEMEFIGRGLYRIHYFDTDKEGDTCRTRFVHKMRKILDEREFISEFSQLWQDVKAGKIKVENPWKR